MHRSPREFGKVKPSDISRRGFLVGAASLVAAPALSQSVSGREAFISPDGSGDGSSLETAAPYAALGDLVGAVGAGGTVYIIADRGEYSDWDTAIIGAGGAANAPVSIRGVDSNLRSAKPVIKGERKSWRRPGGQGSAVNAVDFGGNTAMQFHGRAAHLHFSSLSFVNVGRIFDFSGHRASGITVEDVSFFNVRDGFFTDEGSILTNVVLRSFSGIGFSKKGIRMHGKSRNWLIENCELDSGWQFGDNFAVGVELNDTARDLLIHGGYTINCFDTQDGDPERYWNADGVASERGNRNIEIVDHKSSGHSDGGYDLKSENTTLTRCVASDNKRNYRIWGGTGSNPIQLVDCQSIAPRSRGGSGDAAHLWMAGANDGTRASSAIFRGGSMRDTNPGSAAVYTDGDGVVVHFIDADLSGLGRRETLVEGEGENQTVIVGSASDPDISGIAADQDIAALEDLSVSVPLTAEGQASWRLIDAPLDGRFSIVGASLLVHPGPVGQSDTVTVQARGRNGVAVISNLHVSVVPNPVAPGVALAVTFTGENGAKSATDRTGLNQVHFAGNATIQDNAVQFSRDGDFVTIPDSDNFSFDGPFTIDTEFMLTNPQQEDGQDVVSHWGDPSRQRGYQIRAGDDGAVAFVWTYDGSDRDMSYILGPILEPGRYYKVRVDRDVAGTVRLYVDGNMVGSVRDSAEPILNSAVNLRISGRDSGKYGANGRMRSLMITKGYALTGSDFGYQP